MGIMRVIGAYRSEHIAAGASAEGSKEIPQGGAKAISVEIADAARLENTRSLWTAMLARADALNVFMDPALVRVAAGIDPGGEHRALLAWKSVDGRRQLVGIWTFRVGQGRKSVLPFRILTIPAYAHAYLATPIVDRDCLDDTLHAMLDRIADDPQLPKIIALDAIGTDGPTYEALRRVLAHRGSAPCILEEFRRPKLASDLDGKVYLAEALSGSTRKKLRQHRRKLSERGDLAFVIASEPAAVRRALEEFLVMEAKGWKGQQGTALLSDSADAAFMRGAVSALAELGCASIHSLYLDGKPVSMQIVARCGTAAFTWKTAYDETLRDFSPGMLLLEDYTAAFLADKSIAFVDSCSLDDSGYMSAWSERQPVADLWIDARRGGSLTFRVLSGLQKNYRNLRAAAKSAYLSSRTPR
jgi:CelD/BcsL family acetyltransferase involved in cellulose biosynthesis